MYTCAPLAPAAPPGKPRCCLRAGERRQDWHSGRREWEKWPTTGMDACWRSPARKQHLGLPRGAAGAMDAPSAFESAPTDPTRWRWRESCGPVLQVGGVGGRALGPRHGPSRSVADLKTLLQRQGATTMPRTDPRPTTSSISEGVRFFVLSPRASAPSARGHREMREFPGLALGAEVSGVVVPPLKHIFPETQKHGITYKSRPHASTHHQNIPRSNTHHVFAQYLFDTFALIEELLQCITNKVKTC